MTTRPTICIRRIVGVTAEPRLRVLYDVWFGIRTFCHTERKRRRQDRHQPPIGVAERSDYAQCRDHHPRFGYAGQPRIRGGDGLGDRVAAGITARSRGRARTPFDIAAVVTDRECRAEQIAAERGIAHIRCRLGDHPDRAAWDRALTESVAAYAPEWVVTAGFMKILGPEFLARFGGRVVNSHPALLPSFPGAHGVAEALAYGVKVTGATVHLVDDGIDTGPILAQQVVEVEPDDDVDTLHERIKTVERVLLADVVTALVTHGVDIDGRKARIP